MRKLYLVMMFAICVSAGYAQIAPKAVNDVATVAENGTVVINVLANDSNFNAPDSVCLTALWGGPTAWASVQGCGQVVFHPLNPTFAGLDTFYYRSCDQQLPTLCDTGRVIVTVFLLAPKALSDTATLIAGDSVTMNVLANDSNFNAPDSLRITNIWGAPAGWARVKDSTNVIFHALNPNYYGLVSFHYRSFDRHIPTLIDTGLIVVNVIRKPKAYVDSATLIQPDTSFIYVVANDSDFNAFDSACVTGLWGAYASSASIQNCNQVVFHPASFNTSGRDTFFYRSCYTQTPTLCDTAEVIVQVILPMPQIDFYWNEDSPCVAQVYNNSSLIDSFKWTIQYLSNNGTNETLYNVNQFPLTANAVDSGFDVQVCLTGYNPSGDSTLCYSFWIQCSLNTGINAIASTHLSIYPDPASDRIHIDLSKSDPAMLDGAALVIYDMVGKELKAISAGETGNTISISDLSPGIYLIGVLDKNGNKKMLSKFEVMR